MRGARIEDVQFSDIVPADLPRSGSWENVVEAIKSLSVIGAWMLGDSLLDTSLIFGPRIQLVRDSVTNLLLPTDGTTRLARINQLAGDGLILRVPVGGKRFLDDARILREMAVHKGFVTFHDYVDSCNRGVFYTTADINMYLDSREV